MLLISSFVLRRSYPFILLIALLSLKCAPDYSAEYKNVVHTFNEAWNTGNYDLLDETVHPQYFKQEGDMEIRGIEALKDYVRNWRQSMQDAKIIYIDEVYGSEKAAIFFTLEGIPNDTGKKFKAEGVVFFRFADGKIIEDKSVFDQLSSLLQQGYTIVPPTK